MCLRVFLLNVGFIIEKFDKNSKYAQSVKSIQGASLELSPPLLYSYEVEGVTVPVTHPV